MATQRSPLTVPETSGNFQSWLGTRTAAHLTVLLAWLRGPPTPCVDTYFCPLRSLLPWDFQSALGGGNWVKV